MDLNHTLHALHLGLPEDVERLRGFGDYAGAAAAIDRHLASDKLTEPMRNCLTAQRERLRRLPADYPLTRAEALALARKQVPDFSQAEFDALEQDCRIDFIYINGEKRYFDRFFETLTKTDREMARRAAADPVGSDGHDNFGRLERTLEKMHTRGSAAARIRCRATLRLKEDRFRPGVSVRALLPLPCACESQSEIRIEEVSPAPAHISPENAPQRVILWEEVMEENHPFTVEFSYVRTARFTDLREPVPTDARPAFHTEEQLPHIRFTPAIRALAAELTEGISQPLEQARAFYDYVTTQTRYSYMPAYFSLENIPDFCIRNHRGDCGVMALLFITLCRCAGIPARWESGWKTEPGFCGAHDWAQFYVEPYGWLYADPSFGCGAHREGDEARRQHYFGSLDPFRMTANTAFEADFDVPWEDWRADPYDNQVGELAVDGRGLAYGDFLRTKEVLDFTEL